ncbi:hypothetical protein HFO09_29210 [Rhizobium laguerreae]|uniref:hypothetical protein n=1 Tax=Rhizobium laguerreae TaxID=1076926 RepID=UPI001C907714|nr:hypothetical protein [Rhizobium laguerreae]MBY3258448.1 hypothetical protein [Rhizobium laguerreae]MBY3286435.1 hypothetical protein [Rhizobium laguerreae]MBY3293098.1 hypothetical protein [Rhizobium laguerreae]
MQLMVACALLCPFLGAPEAISNLAGRSIPPAPVLANHPLGAEWPIPFTYENARALGHTEEDFQQLQGATGMVHCAKIGFQPFYFQATMIGLDGQIATVAHNFANAGKNFDFDKCSFINGLETLELDLSGVFLGTNEPDKEPGKDIAFARLTRAANSSKPLPLFRPGTLTLEAASRALIITSQYQDGVLSRLIRPVAIRRFSRRYPDSMFVFGSIRIGDSGGLVYTFSDNGTIAAIGMVQGGSSLADNLPYNDSTRNTRSPINYNVAVTFTNDNLSDLVEFASGRDVLWAN